MAEGGSTMAEGGIQENYSSGDSSVDENDQVEDVNIDPYPYLGRPYDTSSVLNTIDVEVLKRAIRDINRTQAQCLQLEVAPEHEYGLGHVLFGPNSKSFSKTAANLRIVPNGSIPFAYLLPLPSTKLKMEGALNAINSFFSGSVVNPKVYLQGGVANKEMVADVPSIVRTVATLTVPPWIIHQECKTAKEEGSCQVPHGNIDVIIGKPVNSLMRPPAAGIAVAIVEKDKKKVMKPFTPIAPVSAKVQVQLEKPKSERQIVLELLAFGEVMREDGYVIMIKASKSTFRPYVYIRSMDFLFKLPKFNYASGTPTKIEDSIKGRLLDGDHPGVAKFRNFGVCGWAQAVKDNNASYKQEILIEKPQQTSNRYPSPILQEEVNDDQGVVEMEAFNLQVQRQIEEMTISDPV